MKTILLKGTPVSHGVASGKARVVRNSGQIDEVEHGDVMVIPDGHPSYAIGAMKASGLICEVGGRLSHICIVAIEMGIPCITQAADAMKLLEGKGYITLDANKGVVYE